MKKGELEKMITIPEAAELVGVSRQSIYHWIKTGFLGYEQKGYFRLVNKDAVLAISEVMKQRKRGGTSRGKRK
jgi:excisionase family DNA binding protein